MTLPARLAGGTGRAPVLSLAARIRTVALAACIGAFPDAVALAQSGLRPAPADGEPEPSVVALVSDEVEIGAAEQAPDLSAEAGALTGRPVVRPARVAAPPAIDGRLNDAAWAGALRITEFVQLQPLDGAPSTEATDVYLAYDSTAIYLGFRARYTDPGMLRANRSDRDRTFRDDLISVYFDTFLDQQRAYVFTVNAYGVQGDSIINSRGGGGFGSRAGQGQGESESGGGLPSGDESWDALFTTAGRLVEDGFTAEMAIPFKSLRYPQQDGVAAHRWGLQIARRIGDKDETSSGRPCRAASPASCPRWAWSKG